MMQLEDIKKLADLARLDMTEEEMKGIAKDFDSILSYVGQIQEISGSLDSAHEENNVIPHNIMREDTIKNEGGQYTEEISRQFPESQDGYLKVKQIL